MFFIRIKEKRLYYILVVKIEGTCYENEIFCNCVPPAAVLACGVFFR